MEGDNSESVCRPGAVRVEAGSWRDYLALSAWHYLAGTPATVDAVLRAFVGGCDAPAGVLVVSFPTLFGWWREIAWPGLYTAGSRIDRSVAANRLNRDVRTISRVIVDPRFRGLGVAAALVRAYLAAPRTRRTEAAAAMGALCPFFARAGMREHRAGPDAPARAIARWLQDHGIRRADLVHADRAERVLCRKVPGGAVHEHLRRWCRGYPSTHAAAELAPAAVAAAVAARIGPARGPARVAYTWPV